MVTTLAQLAGVIAVSVVWGLLTASAGGVAVGLSPILTWVATVAGALVSSALVILAGDKLRVWLTQRYGQKRAKEGGRIRAIWERYGVIGWGLIAPVVLGAPVAAAIGVGLGAPRKRLLFWLSGGVLVWTTVGTVVAAVGLEAIRQLI